MLKRRCLQQTLGRDYCRLLGLFPPLGCPTCHLANSVNCTLLHTWQSRSRVCRLWPHLAPLSPSLLAGSAHRTPALLGATPRGLARPSHCCAAFSYYLLARRFFGCSSDVCWRTLCSLDIFLPRPEILRWPACSGEFRLMTEFGEPGIVWSLRASLCVVSGSVSGALWPGRVWTALPFCVP